MNRKNLILKTTLAFGIAVAFFSCSKVAETGEHWGFVPVYDNITNIAKLPPRAYSNPGKILQWGSTTLQVDEGSGIHVIDCSVVENAQKIAFIQVSGITDIHKKDDVIYADHLGDLVAIKMDAAGNVTELDRIKKAFEVNTLQAPPEKDAYFECVDLSKGKVIKWERKVIKNPQCRTL
jgi:hypothetical protein